MQVTAEHLIKRARAMHDRTSKQQAEAKRVAEIVQGSTGYGRPGAVGGAAGLAGPSGGAV